VLSIELSLDHMSRRTTTIVIINSKCDVKLQAFWLVCHRSSPSLAEEQEYGALSTSAGCTSQAGGHRWWMRFCTTTRFVGPAPTTLPIVLVV
jgi:hypothetical protein